MAVIEIEEPATTKESVQSTPQYDVPETNQDNKHSLNVSSKHRKRLVYGVILLVALFILIQFAQLSNEAAQLEKQVAGRNTSTTDDNPNEEAIRLAREIGQFLDLPSDETPTVATVVDASKVRSQTFFAHAQDNDKVLLFERSGRAVLFRPSTNKVIEFSPTK